MDHKAQRSEAATLCRRRLAGTPRRPKPGIWWAWVAGGTPAVQRILTLHYIVVTLKTQVEKMRKHYDFSKAKRNPYARRLKRQVTIRLDQATVAYFKNLPQETGIPYQTLINLYLRECASTRKKLSIAWRASAEPGAA